MSAVSNRGFYLALLAVAALCWSPVAAQNELKVGYSALTPEAGSPAPLGTALFTFQDSAGVLVSQAGVGAVELVAEGRVFVDQQGTRTAIAIVNAGNAPADLRLELRNPFGGVVDSAQHSFAAGEHVALFVDELFDGLPSGFVGSLTFFSEDGIARWASVTLRQSLNQSGQPIFATLPVASDSAPGGGADRVVFPQVGAGAGLSTQIVLINPSALKLTGVLRLSDSQGDPLQLELGGTLASEFPISIEENGVARLQLTRSDGQVGVGYASVTTDQGVLPGGTAIFQFTAPGGVISEAGVAAAPFTRHLRLFVDNAGTRTGVALANPGNGPSEVLFKLLDREQRPIETRVQSLPAGGHLAIFADEIFPDLPEGFTGLLEIECDNALAPVTLKLTLNSRGEPILTTLPVLDLDSPIPESRLIFPQVGFGLGFSTRLILMNADLSGGVSGNLAFFQSDGSDLTIPIGGEEASEVAFDFGPGGSRQFYPGETARIAEILIDPNNLTVNQGGSVPLRPITIDESGNPRDDFILTFESLNPQTITVTSDGVVTALNRGFSTVLVGSGDLLRRFTVTSGTVTSGSGGFQPRDVVQDFAGRIYLANSFGHTVLQAESLESGPEVYAGAENQSGFKNGPRLQARFDSPSALEVNQGVGGELYISDSGNNTIRLVRPGADGETETLAGRVQAGSQDGKGTDATFRQPGGLALDEQGYLWVCDTGNHTLRRIRLQDGTVVTVAGSPGNPGFTDGTGTQARFNTPSGIVFEAETLTQQLIREQTGAPPPPASVIVADTGNGALRRVYEDGRVETLGVGSASPSGDRGFSARQGVSYVHAAPYTFSDPTGLALDPFGNLYVSEASTGLVKVVLRNGDIVPAAERNTFSDPGGMAITIRGRVLVAEGKQTVQQIRYAGPSISSVEPARFHAGGGQTVTLTGRNIAPESLIIVSGIPMQTIEFIDTQTVRFVTPELPSGKQTLTVQHRGGLAQTPVEVSPISVDSLAAGEITTVVGGTSDVGDGSQATTALLAQPSGVAVLKSGKVLVADSGNHRVRLVDPVSQIITTIAGSGLAGKPDDETLALQARLDWPVAAVPDSTGDLLIADGSNNQIYRISTETGRLQLVAGTGAPGFSGDGGPAQLAQFHTPIGIALDDDGNIFVADSANHRIRRIAAATNVVSTVAGTGTAGFSGDGGPAELAELDSPRALAFGSDGSLIVADTQNHRLRSIGQAGIITTLAGTGTPGYLGDGGPSLSAQLDTPAGIAVDPDGTIFIADSQNHRVRRVSGGSIETVAGTGLAAFGGDQGPGVAADLNSPLGLVVDASNHLLITDAGNNRIRELDLQSGIIRTAVGSDLDFNGDGANAAFAVLSEPRGLAAHEEALFVSEAGGHRIRQIQFGTQEGLIGSIQTIVGTGLPGDLGTQADPLQARLKEPSGLDLLVNGTLVIADSGNHRIRSLQNGTLSLVTGTGEAGYLDDVPGPLAQMTNPLGVAHDLDGGVLFADTGNHLIRKLSSFGYTGPLVGNGNPGYSGDGGRPFQASLNSPSALVVADDGRIFISDTGNHRIRLVNSSRDTIVTIAGNGQAGFSGDGGPATEASLNSPRGLLFDGDRKLFIADSGNHRVRVVDLITGEIQTVVGVGEEGFGGDGGPADSARLSSPWTVIRGLNGDLLISDQGNGRIRLVRGIIEP